jgi:hypothetical protein
LIAAGRVIRRDNACVRFVRIPLRTRAPAVWNAPGPSRFVSKVPGSTSGAVMPSLVTVLKCAALLVAGTLWALGLVHQFDSFEMTARYVALSAAMVVVATV